MKNWLKVYLLLFIFGLLVYSNSLNNKLLMDDYFFMTNPLMSQTKFIATQWDPFREKALGITDSRGRVDYYRPLTQMVYNFSYATFKKNFWKYHLLVLVFFVLASSLVYVLIEKLTGNAKLALLAGLFYLLHPINGDVVNYFPAGVCAFQLVFMLGSILLLLESLERKSNLPLYLLSLLFSFLTLFWHERGIMTPFYIGAVILIFRDDTFKKKAWTLMPFFLIIIPYLFFRLNFIGVNENLFSKMTAYHITAGQYLASLFRVYTWYIGKIFYPSGIGMQYSAPVLHEHLFLNALGAFLLPVIWLCLFARFFNNKLFRLALVWILIGFAPVCLAAFRTSENGFIIEPNWFVFSSIGFFILAAGFCLIVLDRMKKTGLALLFVIVFAMGSFAHAYNQVWSDQKTYSQYWLQQDPYMKSSYEFLGDYYFYHGDGRDAEKYFRIALSGNSTDWGIYNNLGSIALMEGRYKDAEKDYKMVLKFKPNSADVYNNLGFLYYAQGRFQESRENAEKALQLNPLLTAPRIGLASIDVKDMQYQKAIDLCLKNLEIIKDDSGTLLFLIDVYLRLKDSGNVNKYTTRFINAETDPVKLTKLGIRLAWEKFIPLALDCFTKSMRLAPDYKYAYLSAGTLYANLGQFDEAIRIWKIGSRLDPMDPQFKTDIAQALQMKNNTR